MLTFEWDEAKRLRTLRDRQIDFRSADLFFDGRPVLTARSDRGGETRFATTAVVDGVFTTVVWTQRKDRIRIISMRKSHGVEERAYRQLYG